MRVFLPGKMLLRLGLIREWWIHFLREGRERERERERMVLLLSRRLGLNDVLVEV